MIDVVDGDAELGIEEIREIIECDIAGTQRWRGEKALEYPDDNRNKVAERLLGTILATLETVSPQLLRKHNRAWTHAEEGDGICASEAWSQTLREVGFHCHVDDATDLIEVFLDRLS